MTMYVISLSVTAAANVAASTVAKAVIIVMLNFVINAL